MIADSENNEQILVLNEAVSDLIKVAGQEQEKHGHEQLGLQHLLVSLLQTYGPMAERLVSGLDVETLLVKSNALLTKGDIGTVTDTEVLKKKLSDRAGNRGADKVTEQDFAGLILELSGYSITYQENVSENQSSSEKNITNAIKGQPTLERIATNLAQEAEEGKIKPVIGRSEEIDLIVETLCRQTKRNPLLVGPAGVGKTAIVEGLALMIHEGIAPKALMSKVIYSIQPSSLDAQSPMYGQLEKNIEAILAEASDPDVIIFIDEVHSVVGTGGRPGFADIASLLKPALARGEIACIGATTDEEYRRHIQSDKALERRFQPLIVRELGREDTFALLKEFNEASQEPRGVEVPEGVLAWIVQFADDYMKNRHFPDKALDLYESVVANARANDKPVDMKLAETVAQRIVGMPLNISDRLSKTRDAMAKSCQLSELDIDSICNRLDVTVRNLDVRSERADSVILLTKEIADLVDETASLIAANLYGDERRVIEIDMTVFTDWRDTRLLGPPPGYVGYQDTLVLHELGSMPWSVLVLKNIDRCLPMYRSIIRTALQNGFFTMATGQKIYLSDAVVIMTCGILEGNDNQPVDLPWSYLDIGKESFGFQSSKSKKESKDESENRTTDSQEEIPANNLTEYFGKQFLDEIEVVCTENRSTAKGSTNWTQDSLMPALKEAYLAKGISVQFDEDAVQWVASKAGNPDIRRDIERNLEEVIAQSLVSAMEGSQVYTDVTVSVSIVGDELDLAVKK